jgi:hypothetical protein
MTNCDNHGTGNGATTAAAVAAVVAPLSRPLDWHRSDVAWFRGVNAQQPLLSAMLVGALPYGLTP